MTTRCRLLQDGSRWVIACITCSRGLGHDRREVERVLEDTSHLRGEGCHLYTAEATDHSEPTKSDHRFPG